MTDIVKSCLVSSLTKCNQATTTQKNTTIDATDMQQVDLIALSIKFLERNQCNQQCNKATDELHTQTTNKNNVSSAHSDKSCQVAFPISNNHATNKKEELRNLITQVSENYGGDDPVFLAEYIEDTIKKWTHDLDKALICFKNLVAQATKIKE